MWNWEAVGLEYTCVVWCSLMDGLGWQIFMDFPKAIALSYLSFTAWEVKADYYQKYPCQQVGVVHYDRTHGQVKDLIYSSSQYFVLTWIFHFTSKSKGEPENGSQKILLLVAYIFTSDTFRL